MHRLLSLVILGVLAAGPGRAADLQVPVANPLEILFDVYADTQCPLQCPIATAWDSIPRCPSPPCDSIPCCDTFDAIVQNQLQRVPPDFTYLNGDLGIDAHAYTEPAIYDLFFDIWNQVPEPKSFAMGNHEADPATDSTGTTFIWPDPQNHYAPANWWEPLFGCDSTTVISQCRRWYSVYFGSPPRAALFVTSNNSDTDTDNLGYIYCSTPTDFLNSAGSPQRTWFNAQIDSLPSTVDVVFVAGHRTYYGVEKYLLRPNILTSYAEWPEAPAETLRTGAVSYLRDVESIYDRKPNVKWVLMLNGDQHCFAQTVPIRQNVRDDQRGVPYITLGISGAPNNRGTPFPNLIKIPPGTLVHAFDESWGSVRFHILTDRVVMDVHEAYSDSLMYTTFWPFDKAAVSAPVLAETVEQPEVRVRPNPVKGDGVEIAIRVPVGLHDQSLEEIAVYSISGRRVRTLPHGRYVNGEILRTWRLDDDSGRRVAAGIYLLRVRLGDQVLGAKIDVRR